MSTGGGRPAADRHELRHRLVVVRVHQIQIHAARRVRLALLEARVAARRKPEDAGQHQALGLVEPDHVYQVAGFFNRHR
jgi:hypothetical protein